MPRDHDSPEDLSAFLSRPEDLARALDARAAEERTRETLRKAAENANFAAAMKALEAGPKEETARPAQPSERAEYNAAKTIPPRTRRDTLELEAKLVVRSDVLDSRHRPTAKIARPAAAELDAGAASAPPVAEHSPVAPSAPETPESEPPPSSGKHSTLEGLGQLGAREIEARANAAREGADIAPDHKSTASPAASAQVKNAESVAPEPAGRADPLDASRDNSPPKTNGAAWRIALIVGALLVVAALVSRCRSQGNESAAAHPSATPTVNQPEAVATVPPEPAPAASMDAVPPEPMGVPVESALPTTSAVQAPPRPGVTARPAVKPSATPTAAVVAPVPVRTAEPEEFILKKKKDDGQR